jgi:hypothetical protein
MEFVWAAKTIASSVIAAKTDCSLYRRTRRIVNLLRTAQSGGSPSSNHHFLSSLPSPLFTSTSSCVDAGAAEVLVPNQASGSMRAARGMNRSNRRSCRWSLYGRSPFTFPTVHRISTTTCSHHQSVSGRFSGPIHSITLVRLPLSRTR